MIPIIYDKTGNTKYGELVDCIKGIVIEVRNGLFQAEVQYCLFSPHWDKLIRGNIIIADANDILKNQKFRINKVSKPINGQFTVKAKHISYDMARDIIEGLEIESQSCEYCLNQIFRSSQFSQHFKGHSDIINSQNFKIKETNPFNAIAGTEGSIIDTFGTGAELLRDNTDIYVLNKRGHDNGVTIEYGKNLTGITLDEDDSNMITRIKGYAKYANSENEEVIIYTTPKYIDSTRLLYYETPFIESIDFSSYFEDDEIPTSEKLKELVENYFIDTKCDLPKTNAKISFIPLSKCVGYEDIEDKISLCDTVTIKDYRYNYETKAKVIKTTYNFLTDRYESMEVGEPRSSLGDIISGGSEESKPGPPGPQGPPGADGNIGDFPDSLPSTPVLSSTLYGFANIELSWTFENQIYYSYELYASKTKDFTPNTFDLIFQGQASTFLFQAKPNETWYFRCCAVNSHGKRTSFSEQISVTTTKVSDLSNYVESAAIGDALIGTLSLDRGWVGELRGNYIDAKQLSVTDGNGKRTLWIDSFGNVNLDVTSLKISAKDVATTESVTSTIKPISDELKQLKTDVQSDIADVNKKIDEILTDVGGAIADGVIDEAETIAIANLIDSLNIEKADIDNRYNSVYGNANLNGTAKTNLNTKYTAYKTAHTNLINNINSMIADKVATEAEKITYKTKINEYSTALSQLSQAFDNAIYNISLNEAMAKDEDLRLGLQSNINDVSKVANEAKNAIGNYTADSILDEAEKESVKTHLKSLASEKADVDKEYTTLYATADLTGTAKTNLKTAYDNYVTKYNDLVSNINTLVNAATITDTMRANITNAFTTHDAYLATYSLRVNEAITAISEKKKQDAITTSNAYYDAQIKIDKQNILSTVSSTYSTKTELTTAKNDAISSANSNTSNLLKSYSTTTQMNSAIDQKASSITSRVSSVESSITTINGNVTSLQSRMNTAEQKITSDAIVNSISSSINNGTTLTTTSTTLDKNGLTIKNGGLIVKNNAGTTVLQGDTSGNLTMKNGCFKVLSSNNSEIASIDQNNWMRVQGLHVFGAGECMQNKGAGVRSLKLVSTDGNATHIDFNYNATDNYAVRLIREGAGSRMLKLLGSGLTVQNPSANSNCDVELRSNGGPVYIDFSHDINADYETRIITYQGDSKLHIVGGLVVDSGTKSAMQTTENYGNRLMYAVEACENYFEDVYNCQLVDGECVVEMDKIFLECVNTKDYDYFLIIDELEECEGLFAPKKLRSWHSFTVKEKHNGKSNIEFNVIVRAKRKDFENVRLEEMKSQPETTHLTKIDID